ncbi:efflux RND transporter periplasmic adaptor subunit [Bosea sp. CS1GBMeth4]|uniref:efflux RND transporter periplasmic adaptor subunit n=1 Tax=Bosea sp. CS1GBMeth4 TaxID=1892849 RepID=UPI001FCF1822|nr:efflux RND transporter periplasmic adaptor subunit [Bosea sp. CS1GBMeth4]
MPQSAAVATGEPAESGGGFRSAHLLRRLWAYRWFGLALAVAAGVAAWQASRALIGPAVVVDVVRRGDLIQTVVASGHVETPYRVEIGSQITGTVEEVLVEEGQTVAKGQPLILLDNRELRAALVQAQGAVAQAEARLRQMQELVLPAAREALTQTQAVLLNAQQSHDRTVELARTGSATRAALDEAVRALNVARTQARSAELQVFTASPGGSDAIMAQAQLDQARANLETASSRLGYATISAPRDGILISRAVERGTVAQPGKALLVLAPRGETQLVIQLDERNLGLVAPGQPALASADAFPNERMEAVLVYINPGIDIARAAVEVKLRVAEPPAYLRQDMTVSVDIETARRSRTLVVPARSVRDAVSPAPWVMRLRQGRASRQPVRLGLRGASNIEILDGVAEGDELVPANSGVVTGQRIRAVRP